MSTSKKTICQQFQKLFNNFNNFNDLTTTNKTLHFISTIKSVIPGAFDARRTQYAFESEQKLQKHCDDMIIPNEPVTVRLTYWCTVMMAGPQPKHV
jgi:hypothetical protein